MRYAVYLLLALLGLGCKPADNKEAEPVVSVNAKPFSTLFQLQLDGKPFLARLALTESERAIGLSGAILPEGEGMLFVHPTPVRARFWMRDTPSDLDIGFFDRSGRLLEVRTMRAHDTQAVESQSEEVRLALEMRAGWFADAGIRPGAKFDLYPVINAIRERGFNPTRLGL